MSVNFEFIEMLTYLKRMRSKRMKNDDLKNEDEPTDCTHFAPPSAVRHFFLLPNKNEMSLVSSPLPLVMEDPIYDLSSAKEL